MGQSFYDRDTVDIRAEVHDGQINIV